jgi:hypothetical protein
MPYGGALIMWALKILGVGYSAWLGLLNLFLGGGLFFQGLRWLWRHFTGEGYARDPSLCCGILRLRGSRSLTGYSSRCRSLTAYSGLHVAGDQCCLRNHPRSVCLLGFVHVAV